jgi:hypothetical protein
VKDGQLQSDVDSIDAESKRGSVATVRRTRARVTSDSAEEAEPRTKRQRQAQTLRWNMEGAQVASMRNAKVSYPDRWRDDISKP